MSQQHTQDIEFILRARNQASGQFEQVEESARGVGETLAHIATFVLPILTTAISFVVRRFNFFQDALGRVGRFLSRAIMLHRGLAIAMAAIGAAGFLLTRMMDSDIPAATLQAEQSMRLFRLRVIAAGDAIGESFSREDVDEVVNFIQERFGEDAAAAFFASAEAARSMANVMGDEVLRDALLETAERLVEEYGISLPEAFHVLERLHAGDSGPLNQLIELNEGNISSMEEFLELLDRAKDEMGLWERIIAPIAREWEKLNKEISKLIEELFAPLKRDLAFLAAVGAAFIQVFITPMISRGLILLRWAVDFLRVIRDIAGVLLFRDWEAVGRLWQRLNDIWDNGLSLLRNIKAEIAAIWDNITGPFSGVMDFFRSDASTRRGELGLPFDNGGIVPGPIGAPVRALLHGGETVLPTHKGGGLPIVVQLVMDRKVIGEVAIDAVSGVAHQRSGIRRMMLSEAL